MGKPIRHERSKKNRRKALHFAKNAHEELEHLDRKLRRLLREHIRYALGRTERLINRLKAEQ